MSLGAKVLVDLALGEHRKVLCRHTTLPPEADLWFVYRDEAHFSEAVEIIMNMPLRDPDEVLKCLGVVYSMVLVLRINLDFP